MSPSSRNGPKVAQWMSEHLERPIHPQRGWEYLRSFEMRLKVPRPAHDKGEITEQEQWKKKLNQKVQEVGQKHPEATVEVWAMDEHRLGLKPICRRVWAQLGSHAIANVNWKYQWLWLYGFVNPNNGETYYWILPKVNVELFNRVLEDFAREFQLGEDKHIILTIDRAGWHTSSELKIPLGLHLEYLPPYSPELQPAERLWPLINEPIANRSFTSLEELEEILFERCQVLLTQQFAIKAITQYHWWPKIQV
ncbi:IS630 family transposase [Okeania hirsuta]|uniref:IS630 family transposase n=2 Tax=Okeania TaxID=1458928 RepID=A0A3N6QF05_9CYAN|nr:IS630 family transposase [Okeania hirsuta]